MKDHGASLRDRAGGLRPEPPAESQPKALIPSAFGGKWNDCPNARQTLDKRGYIVMRCLQTGTHPDHCRDAQ